MFYAFPCTFTLRKETQHPDLLKKNLAFLILLKLHFKSYCIKVTYVYKMSIFLDNSKVSAGVSS